MRFFRDDELVHNLPSKENRPRAIILVPNRELGYQTLVMKIF